MRKVTQSRRTGFIAPFWVGDIRCFYLRNGIKHVHFASDWACEDDLKTRAVFFVKLERGKERRVILRMQWPVSPSMREIVPNLKTDDICPAGQIVQAYAAPTKVQRFGNPAAILRSLFGDEFTPVKAGDQPTNISVRCEVGVAPGKVFRKIFRPCDLWHSMTSEGPNQTFVLSPDGGAAMFPAQNAKDGRQ